MEYEWYAFAQFSLVIVVIHASDDVSTLKKAWIEGARKLAKGVFSDQENANLGIPKSCLDWLLSLDGEQNRKLEHRADC